MSWNFEQWSWSSAPVAYSLIWPKSQIYDMIYNMMVLYRWGILLWCWKNPWTQFWIPTLHVNGHDPAEVPKFKYALSISYFVRNKTHLIISLFFNWPTTKKCAPYFRGRYSLKKLCFDLKLVDGKYLNGHNFSLT
jgi:hypothetical protein